MAEQVVSARGPIINQPGKDAVDQKQSLAKRFFIKGITVAILSGMCYGLYSAFLTVGMGKGVWELWYGGAIASVFTTTYVLGALGSAVNDTVSAVWSMIVAATQGKLGDVFRCLRTKPGLVMMLCALVGGPIASTAYVVALQMAGSLVIPITALCPAIGAILARILFKTPLNARMLVGIAICITASIMIGSTSFSVDASPTLALGLLIALIAALGWGIEGCVAGYGTTLVDYQIGITIRQGTSGLSNMIILIPIMTLIAGDIKQAPELIIGAFTSGPAMIFFVVSGFFAMFAYSLWYKGNSMCGAPLGMACNGAYSFWGPFFCWIVLGLVFKQEGWALAPIAWVAAVVMIVGICLIAFNPLDFFKKDKQSATSTPVVIDAAEAQQINDAGFDAPSTSTSTTALGSSKTLSKGTKKKPLNYAILKYFLNNKDGCAESVIESLKAIYGSSRAFKKPAVVEALMAAEANGLLDESHLALDDKGELRVFYKANDYGKTMITNYIGA